MPEMDGYETARAIRAMPRFERAADHLADGQGDEGRPREVHRRRRLGLHHQAGRRRPAAVADAGVAAVTLDADPARRRARAPRASCWSTTGRENLLALTAVLEPLERPPRRGRVGRGGAARAARRGLRGRPARRPDAGHGRLRDGRATSAAASAARDTPIIFLTAVEHATCRRCSRLRGGRGRLRAQAVRPGRAARPRSQVFADLDRHRRAAARAPTSCCAGRRVLAPTGIVLRRRRRAHRPGRTRRSAARARDGAPKRRQPPSPRRFHPGDRRRCRALPARCSSPAMPDAGELRLPPPAATEVPVASSPRRCATPTGDARSLLAAGRGPPRRRRAARGGDRAGGGRARGARRGRGARRPPGAGRGDHGRPRRVGPARRVRPGAVPPPARGRSAPAARPSGSSTPAARSSPTPSAGRPSPPAARCARRSPTGAARSSSTTARSPSRCGPAASFSARSPSRSPTARRRAGQRSALVGPRGRARGADHPPGAPARARAARRLHPPARPPPPDAPRAPRRQPRRALPRRAGTGSRSAATGTT